MGLTKTVPRTMRELRKERGLGLREFQELTGIHRGILSQIERGRLVAEEDELVAIGLALGAHFVLKLTPIAEIAA